MGSFNREKEEFRKLIQEIRDGYTQDPKGFLMDLLKEIAPPLHQLMTQQSNPASTTALARPNTQPTAQGYGTICLSIKRTPDGRMTESHSVYTLSNLNALSFDPFIVRAEASHDTARSQGFFGLLRLKQEAYLEEKLTDATISKLKSQQRILEEQRKTVEAGHRLRDAMQNPESSIPNRNEGFSSSSVTGQSASVRSALPAPTPLRQSVTGEQIEGAALRALLEGATTEEAWAPYKAALLRHLPPYAVQEVEDRLHELWHLNPAGPKVRYT